MARVWTHGVWTVKAGREDEFVEAWREMAGRGLAELNTAAPPTLLRDRDQPHVFVSFGPWPSIEEVDRFRASEPFRATFARLGDSLERFETRTLDEVGLGG